MENNMLAITAKYREILAAMVLELQSNRAVLFGLTNWFSVFVFTGGRVPTSSWSLAATNSYLQHPPVTDGGTISDMQRYRGLVQTISDMGHTGGGPRTLKCRHSLGARFGLAAAELQLVADALELTMTKVMKALKS
jgi:hypothetical protein